MNQETAGMASEDLVRAPELERNPKGGRRPLPLESDCGVL